MAFACVTSNDNFRERRRTNFNKSKLDSETSTPTSDTIVLMKDVISERSANGMSKTINDLEKMLDKDIEASSLSGKYYSLAFGSKKYSKSNIRGLG